jgi:hypothetical protein
MTKTMKNKLEAALLLDFQFWHIGVTVVSQWVLCICEISHYMNMQLLFTHTHFVIM